MIEYQLLDSEDAKDGRVELFWRCFAPEKKKEEVEKWFDEVRNNQGLFCAMDGDRMVAHMTIVEPLENRIRGANLSFGGIGGVTTLPQYRRQGLIRGLFRQAFDFMNKQNIIFSALAPFNFQFYEEFGYAHAAQKRLYDFPVSLLKPLRGPASITFREYCEEDEESVQRVQRSMSRFGSRVFIPKGQVVDKEKGHPYVFEQNGKLVGFVQYKFNKIGEWDQKMTVSNTWYTEDEGLLSIADLTYRFGSQCQKIEWHVDPEIPLEFFLTEPGKAKRSKEGYMMVRVVKFREFCQQIKVPLFASEPVIVAIEDEHCPWNNGVFKLIPVSGRLEIKECDQEPEIQFDALHLSHAIGGLMTANRLRRMGGLDCSQEAAERFTRIFPPDSYVTYMHF